jgi:hypothetical protein
MCTTGLAFMDQLDQRARELNVLRGTLARWLLPFDTNTAASEQRSVIESVLENEPGQRHKAGRQIMAGLTSAHCIELGPSQ